MKTQYERLYKYEWNQVIFGKPKKRHYHLYIALTLFIILLGSMIG